MSVSGEELKGEDIPQVGVYIESLCPDSRRLFRTQVVPANRQIGSIFKIKIVPFGHARTIGNNKMICQHGERECDGNRKMACSLARAANQSQSIELIGCMFQSYMGAWRDCVKQWLPGVSTDEIDTCSKGDESYKMMIEAEKETGRADYIPHLTLNGKYDQDIQNDLENNMISVICRLYKGGSKPDACRNIGVQ